MKFKTSDGQVLEVESRIMMQSDFVKNMVEDLGETEEEIPLNDVTYDILVKVVEYLQHHVDTPDMTDAEFEAFKLNDDMDPWDEQYFKVDQATLFEIIKAANFLACKRLLNCGCKTVANMIKGRTTEEIRELFGIENDFAPGEEEKIRNENYWCKNLE